MIRRGNSSLAPVGKGCDALSLQKLWSQGLRVYNPKEIKLIFLLILTLFKQEPQAESGAGCEAKQPTAVKEGRVRTGGSGRERKRLSLVGSCWCLIRSLNPRGLPLLSIPALLSENYLVPQTSAESLEVSVHAAHSFIKRWNTWNGEIGWEIHVMGWKPLCFLAREGHRG